MNDENDD